MEEEAAARQACSLPAAALYEFVAGAPRRQYPDRAVAHMLEQDAPAYARMFYILCAANRTLVAASYKATFLHRNCKSFSEEELLLICEGIKLQLERGECAFYYVTHHFFEGLHRSAQLQSFLLYLMHRGDYRIREFLLTHGVAESVFARRTSDVQGRVFVVRFLKAMIGIDNGVIRAHLAEKRLCISIEQRNDSVGFFGKWLEKHGGDYRDVIRVYWGPMGRGRASQAVKTNTA